MTSTNASGCGAESVEPCRKTFTILPDWLAPSGHYSLRCRQQACERIAAGILLSKRRRTAKIHRACPILHRAPMGTAATAQPVVLAQGRRHRLVLSADTHHPCLGSRRDLPYSAHRGKKSVNRQALDELKQQIPLMGYLQAHDWQPGAATQPWPIDGAVSFAWRPQTKLPGGCQQRSVLLLRLWPRRRRDSLCGALSPGEVLAGHGVATPMARRRAVTG